MGNELIDLCNKIKQEFPMKAHFIMGLNFCCCYVKNYSTPYCSSKKN